MQNHVHGPAAVRMRVAIADSLTLCRDGMVSLLSGYPHITVVGSTGSSCDVVEMCKDAQPDILLLCATIADEMTRGQFEAIASQAPTCSVVLLADDPIRLTPSTIPPRVRGILQRSDSTENLLKALGVVASGKTWGLLDGTQPITTRSRRGNSGLSHREKDIAALVAQGLSNREIALKLELSEQSVKNLVSRILKKLGLNNRVQIAMKCWPN
ncbi:MAG: response regulator transcription factor [Fimbriimonadia bacterium]|jgi:DNA-binding NarL/FixJ family response regulator